MEFGEYLEIGDVKGIWDILYDQAKKTEMHKLAKEDAKPADREDEDAQVTVIVFWRSRNSIESRVMGIGVKD